MKINSRTFLTPIFFVSCALTFFSNVAQAQDWQTVTFTRDKLILPDGKEIKLQEVKISLGDTKVQVKGKVTNLKNTGMKFLQGVLTIANETYRVGLRVKPVLRSKQQGSKQPELVLVTGNLTKITAGSIPAQNITEEYSIKTVKSSTTNKTRVVIEKISRKEMAYGCKNLLLKHPEAQGLASSVSTNSTPEDLNYRAALVQSATLKNQLRTIIFIDYQTLASRFGGSLLNAQAEADKVAIGISTILGAALPFVEFRYAVLIDATGEIALNKDPNTLLTDFANQFPIFVDRLFKNVNTGLALIDGNAFGNLGGQAFVGGACLTAFNVGFARVDLTQIAHLVAAHEMLHLVGATHIEQQGNIMNPYADQGGETILPETVSQVTDFLSSKTAQCLSSSKNLESIKVSNGGGKGAFKISYADGLQKRLNLNVGDVLGFRINVANAKNNYLYSIRLVNYLPGSSGIDLRYSKRIIPKMITRIAGAIATFSINEFDEVKLARPGKYRFEVFAQEATVQKNKSIKLGKKSNILPFEVVIN